MNNLIQQAIEALEDITNGWKYIRSTHGDLYGVGWDRAQGKAETALAALRAVEAGELPPLPGRVIGTLFTNTKESVVTRAVTEAELHAYARTAIASAQQAGGQVPPLTQAMAEVLLGQGMDGLPLENQERLMERATRRWERAHALASSPQPEVAPEAPAQAAPPTQPEAAPSASEVGRRHAEYLCKQIDAIRKDVRVVLKQYNDPYAAIDLMAHRIKDAALNQSREQR